jgi:hypothetical protein
MALSKKIALFATALLLVPVVPAQAPDGHSFKMPALKLAFVYPANLDTEDPIVPDNYSFRTRFALHPDEDPEHKGADKCSPLLLAAGTGPDQPLDRHHKEKPGKQVALQPAGGITLNEIFHSCLYRDNPLNSDQKALTDLVENARHIDGAKPIPRTITYQVANATVILGASVPDGHSHTAGYTATIAAIVDNRIFLCSITANDAALFNSMLHSKACFDAPACASGYQTLAPYEIDANADIKPLAP